MALDVRVLTGLHPADLERLAMLTERNLSEIRAAQRRVARTRPISAHAGGLAAPRGAILWRRCRRGPAQSRPTAAIWRHRPRRVWRSRAVCRPTELLLSLRAAELFGLRAAELLRPAGGVGGGRPASNAPQGRPTARANRHGR